MSLRKGISGNARQERWCPRRSDSEESKMNNQSRRRLKASFGSPVDCWPRHASSLKSSQPGTKSTSRYWKAIAGRPARIQRRLPPQLPPLLCLDLRDQRYPRAHRNGLARASRERDGPPLLPLYGAAPSTPEQTGNPSPGFSSDGKKKVSRSQRTTSKSKREKTSQLC